MNCPLAQGCTFLYVRGYECMERKNLCSLKLCRPADAYTWQKPVNSVLKIDGTLKTQP